MLVNAELGVVVFLGAVFVWWFRRTSLYRARRGSGGGVPGQFSRPGPTFCGQRTNVPPLRPELRRVDDDRVRPAARRWWNRSL
jgi:hypothetical protein